VTLPPGQRAVDGFPRFGTHLNQPAPPVPADPVIAIDGGVAERSTVPVAELARLPRRELVADFHCVAGWSATDLRWEGVAFETFYRAIVEPSTRPNAPVTHLVFGGLDGYRSVVSIEDALAEEALIADRLGGRPLDSDHGAPARFVSPGQYGFISTKHLCRIDVHSREPREDYRRLSGLVQVFLRGPFAPHRRARVWEEERNRHLPAWAVRPVYRVFVPPIRYLCERGSRTRPDRSPTT
jgi:DMSO/TMAO reductase YedYZ molybdopterin-dependent catalytic subunit